MHNVLWVTLSLHAAEFCIVFYLIVANYVISKLIKIANWLQLVFNFHKHPNLFICKNKDVCEVIFFFFLKIDESRVTREITVTGAMQFNAEIHAARTMLNDGATFTLTVICSSISEWIEE